MKLVNLVALAAALASAAQPVLAAGHDLALTSSGDRASGAFAGLYVRLPFAGERAAPTAARGGFKLSMLHRYRDPRASHGLQPLEAVDLALRFDGRRSVRLAGHELLDERGRLRFDEAGGKKGGVSTLAIVGLGVAAALGIGYLVARDAIDCTVKEDLDGDCEVSD